MQIFWTKSAAPPIRSPWQRCSCTNAGVAWCCMVLPKAITASRVQTLESKLSCKLHFEPLKILRSRPKVQRSHRGSLRSHTLGCTAMAFSVVFSNLNHFVETNMNSTTATVTNNSRLFGPCLSSKQSADRRKKSLPVVWMLHLQLYKDVGDHGLDVGALSLATCHLCEEM